MICLFGVSHGREVALAVEDGEIIFNKTHVCQISMNVVFGGPGGLWATYYCGIPTTFVPLSMTEEKASRGRPRLAPEDNETRERILNTAQRLFAEKGCSKVTLREVTTAAETNLASVNYYFGSKDQLLLALIRRAAKSVQAKRLLLLTQAQQTHGTTAEKVRQVLHALVAPAILHSGESEADALYGALIARTVADSPQDLTDVLVKQTSHLNPFVEELQRLMPEVPLPELYWRVHFVLNIEHALVTEIQRLRHFSGGLCDTQDRHAILQRVLDFVVPGVAGIRPD